MIQVPNELLSWSELRHMLLQRDVICKKGAQSPKVP